MTRPAKTGAAGLLLLAALLLPHPGRADDAADIRAVIDHQIAAFRRDDGAAAFGYAAPTIQRQFGDEARFMAMVRHAYPPVYHPQSYRFGELSSDDGELVQRVELVGPDGRRAAALYRMEREPDGSWRISGCSLIESPDLST